MEQELKNKIAKYVENIGVVGADCMARSILMVNASIINAKGDVLDKMMAQTRFHTAVLEYLYCDSDVVASELKQLP